MSLFRLFPDEDMQDQLNKCSDFSGVAMEEPIIPSASEAPWQCMFEDEVQKIFTLHGFASNIPRSAVTILEGDFTVMAGNDVFFTDNPSVEIPCQILQGRETVAYMLTVSNPFNRYRLWENQSNGSDHIEEFAAKHFSQGKAVEEVVVFNPYPFT